jgi:hypothetical protein
MRVRKWIFEKGSAPNTPLDEGNGLFASPDIGIEIEMQSCGYQRNMPLISRFSIFISASRSDIRTSAARPPSIPSRGEKETADAKAI